MGAFAAFLFATGSAYAESSATLAGDPISIVQQFQHKRYLANARNEEDRRYSCNARGQIGHCVLPADLATLLDSDAQNRGKAN
jgi:hypothetical protein